MKERGQEKARGQEFAELVHHVLFGGNTFSPKAIASAMGISYDTLYARARNEVMLSADEIRALISVAPDVRLVNYLLRGTNFVAADRIGADETDNELIHRGATRIVIEATDVLEAVERALGDARIDHRDALGIVAEIEAAERALASLRLRVKRVAPNIVKDQM
jgi:hypothetical protein